MLPRVTSYIKYRDPGHPYSLFCMLAGLEASADSCCIRAVEGHEPNLASYRTCNGISIGDVCRSTILCLPHLLDSPAAVALLLTHQFYEAVEPARYSKNP